MKVILASLGFGWSKWETIQENKVLIGLVEYPVTNQMSDLIAKRFDIQQRTNSITGKIQKRKLNKL